MRRLFTNFFLIGLYVSTYAQSNSATHLLIKSRDLKQINHLLRKEPLNVDLLNKRKELVEETRTFDDAPLSARMLEEGLFYTATLDSVYTRYYVEGEFVDSLKEIRTYNGDYMLAQTSDFTLTDEGYLETEHEERTYDENQEVSTITRYRANEVSGDLVPYRKYIYEINEQGEQTYYARQSWENLEEIWIIDYDYTYGYDDQGNTILSEYFSYDDSGEKSYGARETSTYDNDLLIEETYTTWSTELEAWNSLTVTQHVYDESNLRLESVEYNQDGDDLIPLEKEEYEYDDLGNLIVETGYFYESESWVYDYEYNYQITYNDDDKILEEIRVYSSDGENFLNISKTIHEFEGDLESLYEYYYWSDGEWELNNKSQLFFEGDEQIGYESYYFNGSELVGSFKYEVLYDEEDGYGRVLYDWDRDTQSWVKSNLYDYVFDSHRFVKTYKRSVWVEGDWEPLIEVTNYRTPFVLQTQTYPVLEVYAGSSITLDLSAYFTSDLVDLSFGAESANGLTEPSIDEELLTITGKEVVGEDEVLLKLYYNDKKYFTDYLMVNVLEKVLSTASSEIEIFPNPTFDFIQVNSSIFGEGSRYQFHGLSGNLMAEGLLTEGKIDVQQFPKGTYLLRLEEKGKSNSYKIFKQ